MISLRGAVAFLVGFVAVASCSQRTMLVRESHRTECGDMDAAVGGMGGGEGGAGAASGFGGVGGDDLGGAGGEQAGGAAGTDVGGAGGDAGSAGASAGADVGGAAGDATAGAAGGADGGSAGADDGQGGGGSAGGGSAGGAPGCGVSSAGGARGLETLTTFRVLNVAEAPDCSIWIEQYTTTTPRPVLYSTNDGASWVAPVGSSALSSRYIRLNALGELLVGARLPNAKVWVCTVAGCTAPASYPGVSALDDITYISEDRGGVVWATSANHGNAVARSGDHGHTWTAVATPGVFTTMGAAFTVEADPDYGVLLAGEVGTVIQSLDNGATWAPYGLSRTGSAGYHGNLWSLEKHPTTGTLFAAVPNPQSNPTGSLQYHRLTDAPAIWHSVAGMANNWTDMTGFVFQADGSVLSGGNSQPGTGVIWKSMLASDGASWTRVGPTTLTGSVRLHIGRGSGCLYFTDAGGGLKRNCAGY